MGKGIGYARLTVPGRPELGNVPVVIQIGGDLLDDIIEKIKNDISEKADSSALNNKANVSTVAQKADLTVIAPAHSSTSTYSEGDVVSRNGKLYIANQDIDTAESFNASHWDETTVIGLIPQGGSSE